jgi:TPR repeat protein
LRLTVPRGFARRLDVALALARSDGTIVARQDLQLELDGTAGGLLGADGLSLEAQDSAMARQLITSAERFVDNRNLVGARVLYERAVAAGSRVAVLMLARSLDPAHIASFHGDADAADPARARIWYRRASELGIASARLALERLGP